LNILTKISVVVLVLLVVLFCPVVIQVTTQGPNYKFKLESEQAKNEQLSQQARQNEMALRRAQIEIGLEKTRANTADAKLASDSAVLQNQLDQEKARAAVLETNLTKMEMTLKQMQQDSAAKETRNVELVKGLNDTRDEVNKKTDDIRRLNDQFNSQTLNAERYQRESDFLRQQLAQAEAKLEKLESGAGRGAASAVRPDEGPSTGGAAPEIRGSLVTVQLDKNIASVNVGATKGLKKGMIATISRGGKYVGELQIEDVYTNDAAGLITKKQMDPAAGDKIEISSTR
jgi:hypothetical protein